MAYLDLTHAAAAGGRDAVALSPAAPARGLSALDWNVVALARRDRLGSLAEPGPVARALGGLFGTGRRSRLADPRLEALRRFAVHAWHRGYALPVSEIRAFVSAGFSIDQAELVLGSIAGERTGRLSASQKRLASS